MAGSIVWDDSELQAALQSLMTTLPDNTEQALNDACHAVEAEAKMLCPKDSGELRRSIQSEVKRNGDIFEGIVGSDCDYAVYVHEGTGIYSRTGAGRSDVPWVYYSDKLGHCVSTSGIQSTPFLENAMNNKRASIVDYFSEVIGNA